MAEQPDKSEQTEPASPFKLEEAKKKGSVAKSMEVNSVLAMSAALILLIGVGDQFIRNVLNFCRTLFINAGRLDFELDRFLHSVQTWVAEGLSILSPIVVVMMIVGVLATLIQTGPVFSFFPLKPDIKRLNPIQGFKKFLSLKLLFESIKNIIKLIVLTAVIYFTVESFVTPLQSLYQRPPQAHVDFYLGLAATLLFRLVLALIVIALIDFLFSRWDYQRNLRMTRKELKDEIKRREGDPHVRAKRRELERELRQRSKSLSSVPDADLIITNPTHYAVVIKYDRATMIAPVVTGKGMGEMAQAIKQAAYRHNVPVIRSPLLARSLYRKTKMESAISQEFYVGVAKVLRQAYETRRQQAHNYNHQINKKFS